MRRTLRSTKAMLCTTCLETKTGAAFPSANPTPSCDHPIRTCTECMDTWIQTRLDICYQPHIECPECDQQMLAVSNLSDRRAVQRRCFEIYGRIVKGRTPGWRWCLEEDCRDGRVYEGPKKAHKDEEEVERERERKVKFVVEEKGEGIELERSPPPSPSSPFIEIFPSTPPSSDIDGPEIFACEGPKCAGLACVTCDRPWHEGETCTEYAWRNLGHLVEDALSRKVIEFLRAQGRIKDCPNCQCPIEKDGFGMRVYCTRCLCHFGWDEV